MTSATKILFFIVVVWVVWAVPIMSYDYGVNNSLSGIVEAGFGSDLGDAFKDGWEESAREQARMGMRGELNWVENMGMIILYVVLSLLIILITPKGPPNWIGGIIMVLLYGFFFYAFILYEQIMMAIITVYTIFLIYVEEMFRRR